MMADCEHKYPRDLCPICTAIGKRKPTIDDLQTLLESEDDTPIHIRPDGTIEQIKPTSTDALIEALERSTHGMGDCNDQCREQCAENREVLKIAHAYSERYRNALFTLAAIGMPPHRSRTVQRMREIARAAVCTKK